MVSVTLIKIARIYGNMPLPQQDSVFLDVKQKFVYLYGCPSGK